MSSLDSGGDDVREELAAQRAELNALIGDVRDLTDAVASVADQLIRGASSGAGGFAGGRAPWCWRGIDDETAAQLWRDLSEWVAWLRGRYPIAEQLPTCWPRHPELIEELTALRAFWNAGYLDPAAHPSGACDFHDRWLPGMLNRIKTWGIHCGNEHRDRADGVYGSALATWSLV